MTRLVSGSYPAPSCAGARRKPQHAMLLDDAFGEVSHSRRCSAHQKCRVRRRGFCSGPPHVAG